MFISVQSPSSISDRFGRTRTLAVGSGLFFAGSLLLASASTFSALLAGRMMLGIGVGAGLSIDPLYISEISPPEHRGISEQRMPQASRCHCGSGMQS